MNRERGITLIELLIALTIVSLLTIVALPNYQAFVIKGRRADGQALLLQIAALQERWFTENMTYASNLTTLGFANDVQGSDKGYYTVTLLTPVTAAVLLNSNCPTASCFVAEATPVAAQASDGKLALASNGSQFRDANNNNSYADAGENRW
ncbi:MAG: prepilin-type N-terminal cleavage/methylation domain-containing protein [Magnetococcales bacterium]|nr:prepilin-type N-terminal cleavage/methylation domain-containing protein [Magnetococcales bacterium]